MDSKQYAPPVAHVDDPLPEEGVGELRFFSPSGRIGRLRYLAWGFGALLIYYVAIGIAAAVLQDVAKVTVASYVLWIPLLVFSIICGIKRCHDMNISGWWTLTLIFPVIAFAWLFWPGSKGANRFGPPPPANNWGVRVLAFIFPAVFIVGILAAVAIPAYQGYVTKAKAAQQQNVPNR